jgi:hypothetical protein
MLQQRNLCTFIKSSYAATTDLIYKEQLCTDKKSGFATIRNYSATSERAVAIFDLLFFSCVLSETRVILIYNKVTLFNN